ncbi:MAG TPA: hypothetical protein PLN34_07390 [Alloprevotella sp.]|nr:hypothetical protein [Alloprevotella sp.]
MLINGNNKRIAKNTLILYLRMLFTMLIVLYTSRIVLSALGIEDYGLYQTVCGLAAMFSFLMTGMATSTQRFLSFHIGNNDSHALRRTFGHCMATHLIIAGIILILAESAGLWFVCQELSVPPERYTATHYVYQFSVAALCLNVMTVPYSACIIAHEKMNVFAGITVLDTMLKLCTALLAYKASGDRMILYGAMTTVVAGINLALYKFYCNRNFAESKSGCSFKGHQLKNIFTFSSWTLLGQFSQITANQGTALLINKFHPIEGIANAAFGIAIQIESIIASLSRNFFTAFQSRITQSYAAGDLTYLRNLINYASKFSFVLIYIPAVPILINIDWLLGIWLEKVPAYTNGFCLIFISSALINSVSNPLWVSIFATGSIRQLQTASSVLYILDIIVVYVLFKAGMSPLWGPGTKFVFNILIVQTRIFFARKQLPFFSLRLFIRNVIVPLFCSVLLSLLAILPFYSQTEKSGFSRLGLSVYSLFTCIIVIFFVGLNNYEKSITLKYIRHFVTTLSGKFAYSCSSNKKHPS